MSDRWMSILTSTVTDKKQLLHFKFYSNFLPVMIAAYELRSDRPVQTMLADLEMEPGAEEEAGPEEAGVEELLAAAGEHWGLVMAHCAFARENQVILVSLLIISPRITLQMLTNVDKC